MPFLAIPPTDQPHPHPAFISANHVFSIGTSATPTTYARRLYRDADPVAQDLKPSSRSQRASKDLTPEQRAARVKNMDSELATIPPPGIKPIKKKELYKKIRPIEHLLRKPVFLRPIQAYCRRRGH